MTHVNAVPSEGRVGGMSRGESDLGATVSMPNSGLLGTIVEYLPETEEYVVLSCARTRRLAVEDVRILERPEEVGR